MASWRVGIIGTGFGARVHAPMMNAHEAFEVVAIASVRGNVAAAKDLSGIQNVYTNWRTMLEQESLDLLVVASAVSAHEEMVCTAFAQGVHVLCEKPMALNFDETNAMIIARDEAGKQGLVNHEFRFLPARQKVKNVIENGHLGQVKHIRYEVTHPIYNALTSKKRGWLGKKEDGGGLLNALGSHMIDALNWWTNSHLKTLSATLTTHVPEFTDAQGHVEHRTAEDAYQVIGSLKNGTTVVLDLVSAARKGTHPKRLEVFGEKGTLAMFDDNKVLFSDGSDFQNLILGPDPIIPEGVPAVAAPYYKGFKPMLDALHETIQTGEKQADLADFENGRMTQKVLDAIRQSAREGRKVTV